MDEMLPYNQSKWLNHWMQGGTGITNFSHNQTVLYARAIEAYGDPHLYIGPPIPTRDTTTDRALRRRPDNTRGDLSKFWRIFEQIKKEMEN